MWTQSDVGCCGSWETGSWIDILHLFFLSSSSKLALHSLSLPSVVRFSIKLTGRLCVCVCVRVLAFFCVCVCDRMSGLFPTVATLRAFAVWRNAPITGVCVRPVVFRRHDFFVF